MSKVTMLTIIPKELALELNSKKRVQNYNTLPQLNKSVLGAVRAFFRDNVGYENLPMACLRQPKNSEGKIELQADFAEYLPMNGKESVLFVLEMPEDLIVSVDYEYLLEVSESMNAAAGDEFELDFLKDELLDNLTLGISDDSNAISFIPFLDYSRCKFFAAFNDNFEPDKELQIPGISQIDLRELTSFIN